MLKNRFNISLILVLCLFAFTGCANVVDSVKSNMQKSGNLVKASIIKDRGDAAYDNKDYAQAFKAYQSAAELGEKYSQFMLASMYMAGEGVQRSPKKYFHWIQLSANNGYPPANYLVGRAYLPSNPPAAAKYFKIAAKKEHGSAMYMLGWMYATGKGVSQSTSEALAWFRRAEAQAFPVESQLLSKSSLQSYAKQKNISSAKTQKKKLTQQKLVREIQQVLTELGYKPGPIDGLFGSKTRTAIQAFQRKYGMEPDGRANSEILKKIKVFLK
ncbi:MAG: SEL1-like repeat protein [Desulfuromusa sp.]|nr:SEL1-like repeat protein [Desulfuromusa sp.]